MGLKGAISEVELHTLRGRLTAGLLSKAERGDLALALPAGFARGAHGTVTKDPDRAVQGCVELVFSSFLDQRSATKVMRSLRARGLNLPRREPCGDISWTPLTAALLQGIAWCGECGHKLVVQYANGNRYACTHLQHTQGAPMCQLLPADPIDARVVDAFFEAVAPAELEAWEVALRDLRQAEAALARRRAASDQPPCLTTAERAEFCALAPRLPELGASPA